MESNTALLVMDMQAFNLQTLPGTNGLIGHVNSAVKHARKNNIPVIHVVLGFRPGLPEISPSNKRFAALKERISTVAPEDFSRIDPALAPLPGEIVVTKRRISAFAGSDLDVVLRSQGIQHLVLTGIATSGVVLSTLREASDKDFNLTVISDCCYDADQEVHDVLVNKIFPKQAEVITVEEWLA